MLYMCLILFILVTLIVYIRSKFVLCRSNKRLDEKTVIVTGSSEGIGLETAIDFAKRGARLIIACRSEKKGEKRRKYIVNKADNKEVIFKRLDLSSVKSVRKFADEIIEREDKLDILVNNAGVCMGEEYITEDDMSSTMQTNYFGHFLLTLLLVPLLKKAGRNSEASRIVNVTSLAHFIGKIDLIKINDIRYWTSFQIYANSKLCLVLFTRELAKRLEKSNIVVNSADPGVVATYIIQFRNKIVNFVFYLVTYPLRVFFKSPWHGAQTLIHVALDEDAATISGEMFDNCKLAKAATMAYDGDLARKVWDESIKLVKLTDEEISYV